MTEVLVALGADFLLHAEYGVLDLRLGLEDGGRYSLHAVTHLFDVLRHNALQRAELVDSVLALVLPQVPSLLLVFELLGDVLIVDNEVLHVW